MSLKSTMRCPTTNNDCKVSVEREIERLKQREQRKTSKEFKEKMAEGFKSVAEKMDEIRFMTDEQYLNSENMMVTSLNNEQLDKLAELSMKSIMDADLSQVSFSEIYTPKMKCLVKNEEFSSFIYLNGGWLYYEKCPVCGMIKSAENHKQFLDNHVEN